jgi:hypothetical protein
MPSRTLTLSIVLTAALASGGCLDAIDLDSEEPAAVGAVEYAEFAAPGDTLTVGVRVVDISGRPVSDITVSWSVTAGGGTIIPMAHATDASGLATALWALGMGEEIQRARASVRRLPPVEFQVNTGPPDVD